MTTSMTNAFKAQLAAGAQQIGCWLGLASPYTAEIMAGAGFDWLLIDGEHAPNSIPSILAQLQVLAAYPVHAVVRPSVNDPVQIKQLLDLGAQTLLIPMVETAEQARQAVAAVRYPPHGIRGVGSALARGSRWSRHTDYLKQSDREMCVLVQLESARGLQELDQILAVEGVDGVFIGPADLSAALGHLGNPGHPDVQHAIDEAITRIVTSGKAAGILTGSRDQALHYLTLGARFVAVGVDATLLARSAEALAQQFKQAATPAPKPGGVY